MKPILTIIVPSYNTSKYVDECLPTFIDKFLLKNVVVYLIDDGATDDTKEKIMPFVKEYPNYFNFIHKENGGHGSVINYGVHNLVTTKYFKIIDGDDYVETKSLKALVEYLSYCDDDIVISGFYRGLPGSMIRYEPYFKKTNVPEKTTFKIDELKNFNVLLYSCTYKTSLFKNNEIRLREHVFYEDNELRAFPLKYANTYSYIKCYPYCYRYGVEGQSISLPFTLKHKNDADLVMADLIDFYSTINDDNLENIVGSIIASNINFYVEILCSNTKKEMILKCREKWSKYKNNKRIKKHVICSSRYKRVLIRTNFLLAPLFKKRWSKRSC